LKRKKEGSRGGGGDCLTLHKTLHEGETISGDSKRQEKGFVSYQVPKNGSKGYITLLEAIAPPVNKEQCLTMTPRKGKNRGKSRKKAHLSSKAQPLLGKFAKGRRGKGGSVFST